MKSKYIIVHLQLFPILSGVQRVTLDEFSFLDRSQFDAYLICKSDGELPQKVRGLGFKVFFIPNLVRNISIFRDIQSLISLIRILRLLRPNLLHTHSSKTGVIGRVAAKIMGVPVVHTVHGFAFPSSNSYFVRIFYFILEFICGRFTDALITMNMSDYSIAQNKLRIAREKIFFLPNGVRLDLIKPRDHGKAYLSKCGIQRASAPLVVTMVGRLCEQKNPELLLEAMTKVMACEPSIEVILLYVGDGSLGKIMSEKISSLGLEGRIFLLGWREDVNMILSCSDIFVLPSRWEGMPIALLEAMANGLAIVASDIPGNNDLIVDQENGLLFPSGQVDALYDALLTLLNSDDLRARLGCAARRLVESDYSIESHSRDLHRIYSSVASRS